MPLTTTQVRIANLALIEIGKDTINSMTENSEEAIQVSAIWDEIRQEVLNETDWKFAQRKVELAQSATAPEFEFDYSYQLPNDVIDINAVKETTMGDIVYQVRGDQIETDEGAMDIRYTKDETNVAMWSSEFKSCFILKLAASLAFLFRRDVQLQAALLIRYDNKLKSAKAKNGRKGSKKRMRVTSLTTDIRG